MSINIGDNFSYLGKKFLDGRQSFDTLEHMNNCSDVPMGFITFCKENNKRYEYTESGWIEYGSSISDEEVEKINSAYLHSQSPHVQATDLDGLATEEFVANKIAEASLSGGEVDLSGYVTKEELEGKGYLTEIPSDHVTKEELEEKGYLTEIPSDYVTEGELEEKGYLTEIPIDYVTEGKLEEKGYLTEIPSDYVTKEDLEGKGYLTEIPSDYVTEEELKTEISNKIDDVAVNETETNDNQTALDFYADGELVKTIYFSGGGGGGALVPPYISTILPEDSILGIGGIFELQLDFSSTITGRGTAKIFVNDVEVISTSIPQGENVIPMEDKYFAKGTNRVTVYVIDRTGAMSNSLTFYVRYGSLEITSDFDYYTAYDLGAVVRYYFTPTAVDTSLSLTMYMSIDGEVKSGVSCASDTRGFYTFPSNLEVGAHYCEAYVIDGADNKSNVLAFNLIILDNTSLVVASDMINPKVEEGEQLSLSYKVYMKNNTSFITKTYIDEVLVNTATCGLDFAYYRTSSLTEGIHTIKVEVYDVTETVSDYVTWTVTVTPSTYEMLQPAKSGAMFIGTARNMTNSSENKEVWQGVNQDGETIYGILSNFAFNNESGWVDDELLITGASSVEIPVTPLANNARYGFTLDIEFASKMIGIEDALVLKLWDDTKNCGIKITTEKLILRSAEGNECDLYFTDSEMTSVMFIIDRNEGTAKIYLNGVMCSAFHLSDYSIDGVPYLEDFTVNDTILLGGSGHARIKNLRVYQVALSSEEILNNFMANETNKAKQKELVEFQKGDHLPTLTIYCDFSGLGKDDKKPCSITYVSTDEEKYGKSFTLSHKESTCQYQGTSSMAYPIKNYRLNLADENGEKWKYDFPYGQPERRYTLKADFMSSGHWTNTGLTKWVNKNLYNYDVNDEKSMNPKKWFDINNGGSLDDTRECIYGFPCRLILVNDGNTPLNTGQNEPTPGNTKDMGIFNFNHDKDATDTMGFDQDNFPYCASYEVTANSDTSAGAFMSYNTVNPSDMTELDYIKQSFELRFPDEEDVPEGWGFMGIEGEEGTGLKALIDWVDGSTDEEFVRDFEQHFNKDYTFRYFLLVMTLGMVDNLGKNMMLDTWDNKIFMPRFYDCDTICSYDNSGQLKFDVDIEMAQGYWNTSSSRLWTRIRDLFHDELVTKYNNMRQNGMSYESFMECFYDEQIAMIPQKYYNMDYDVKYAPFADSYMGMANGDTYEHLKRWLKNRLIFMDTVYDYAPSYNNDVLTIRANTTELMRLEIETYTPVYQHLSWYNNQMDKKKIDGKTAVEFTGTAMAATDQEVLIYGGSNIKRIKGISSMNPNRMLIGSATRLIELEATNCPLLADINANKANLAPHTYLNKLDLHGCSQLGGNLIVNKSPLLREINIQNTGITGLNLPGSIRNLEVLKLPSAITSLNLNDAGQLHTIEFDNPAKLDSVNMKNCNALKNVTNFDLLNSSNVTLDNSYNTAAELYFRDTTNLTLNNLPNLEKVIYTPNNEHNTFNLTELQNSNNYVVSTSNCPKLKTFMTTAPYRESYNNGDYGDIKPNTTFTANNLDISNTQFTDINFLCTTDLYQLKLPSTVNNFICDSSHDLDTDWLEDGGFDVVHNELIEQYTTDYEGEVYVGRIINYSYEDLLFTGNENLDYDTDPQPIPAGAYYYKQWLSNNGTLWQGCYFYDSDMNQLTYTSRHCTSFEMAVPENAKYFHVYVRYTPALYMGEFLVNKTPNLISSSANGSLIFSMYAPNVNSVVPAAGTWDLYGLNFEDFYTYGMNNDIVQDSEGNITMPQRYADYNITIQNAYITPTNLPTMLYPLLVNEDKPVLGTIDYSNYEGDDLSYAMAYANESEVDIEIPTDVIINSKHQHHIDYESEYEFFDPKTIAKYTCNTTGVLPAFNSDFTGYTPREVDNGDGTYSTVITSNSVYNMPTKIDFSGKTALLSVDYLNMSNVTTMAGMFRNCHLMTHLNTKGWDTSKVTNMQSAFHYCNALTTIDVSDFDTSNVTNMSGMFRDCQLKLTSIVGLENFNTSNVTDMTYMFSACKTLSSLDLTAFDTRKVENMTSMFNECTALTSLDLSNFDTSNVTNMAYMFYYSNNLTSLDISNFDTRQVTTMSNMFRDCRSLTSLDVSSFNTSEVTDMGLMFYGCNNLTSLDISNFNTSQVTTMANMFSGCKALTSLDISNFNTSQVTTMANMFNSCESLTSLDLSNFDTTNVAKMESMFVNCQKLEEIIGIDTWYCPNVTQLGSMFQGANAIKKLDLQSWKVGENATLVNILSFTNACSSLEYLNLAGWVVPDDIDLANVQIGWNTAKKIKYFNLSGWSSALVSQLVPGMMPTYEEDGTALLIVDVVAIPPAGWSVTFNPPTNIVDSLNLDNVPLTVESLLNVLNNLATVTTSPTLTLGTANLAKLTDEQIAIAINKGWTVA